MVVKKEGGLKSLRRLTEAGARFTIGLLFGYFIGVNFAGAIEDAYHAVLTSTGRRGTLITFTVIGAYLSIYFWWRHRQGKSHLVDTKRGVATLKLAAEFLLVGSVGWVVGYLTSLAFAGFIIELFEDSHFPERSHIVSAFAIGMGTLAVWVGSRK